MFRMANTNGAFRQAEILSDVIERNINLDSLKEGGDLRLDNRKHPYAIILTQDCDLDWDYKSRNPREGGDRNTAKEIPSILLCEVDEAKECRYGEGMNSTLWNAVKRNNNDRYHFISNTPAEFDSNGNGLPELTIDFKRYFTVPTDELYHMVESGICNRRTWLDHPYLEHLSHRFSNYLSRIALPLDYQSI